jgi:methionyl-tRNA synthetase
LRRLCDALPQAIDEALGRFDVRAATAALWKVVLESNRFVSATEPWALARADAGERLDAVLAALLHACRTIAVELAPFLPVAAERIDVALTQLDARRGRTLFPKITV